MSSSLALGQYKETSLVLYKNNSNDDIQNSQLEIDVGEVVKKTLCSMALIVTNSALSITVGTMKLTGFIVVPSYGIGWLTKPLHSLNTSLAKHAYTPFKDWAEAIRNENTRIIQTDKVFGMVKGRPKLYPKNYIKHAHDSFKAAVAIISVALSIINALGWLATRPLWLLIVPGMIGDVFMFLPISLNRELGRFTYTPLQNISDKMDAFYKKWYWIVGYPK